MSEFFGLEFSGGPFVIFSPSHLVALVCLLAALLSMGQLRKASTQTQMRFRYGLAAMLIINEALWHIWNAVNGQWYVETMLPLHLCSLFVFLSAIMLVTGSYRIYEFAYLMGIAGAIQPIFTPDLGIYDFPHFRYYQVFLSHGGIVLAAVYMTVVEGYRPYWRTLGKVFLGSNLYMLFVGIVNVLIGSNYLFIIHKPETASLLDVLGPWPWYLLAIEAIGAMMLLLLYLPFALRDVFTARNPNPA
jgi:hypothetical integral membrane protein (TIGR02206 family)